MAILGKSADAGKPLNASDWLKIHVLEVGDQIDENNNEVQIDEQMLADIADAYNADLHEAPIVLGHDSDALREMPDWVPSYGWVKLLQKDGKKLYAYADLSPQLKQWLDQKLYRKVSAAIYTKDGGLSPIKGKAYLRHIAMLGAKPPAIKGLEQFQFSEKQGFVTMGTMKQLAYAEGDEQDTSADTAPAAQDNEAFLATNSADYLRFILSDGEDGYKGEITSFNPEPSADNGWLYDADANKFSGQFIDESLGEPESFDFTITKQGDTWQRSYKPSQQEEPAEEAVDETIAEPVAELSEYEQDSYVPQGDVTEIAVDPAQGEVYLLKMQLAKLAKENEQLKTDQLGNFVDSLYADARLSEGIAARADVVKFLVALPVTQQLAFSEGAGGQQSPQDFAKKLLGKLPQLVMFGEAAPAEPKQKQEDKLYNAPTGTAPNADQLDLHNKVLAYMKENKMDAKDNKAYIQAVKAVAQ